MSAGRSEVIGARSGSTKGSVGWGKIGRLIMAEVYVKIFWGIVNIHKSHKQGSHKLMTCL